MPKDARFEIVAIMYRAGKIKSFRDLFKYIPKTVVTVAMGKRATAMNAIIKDPKRLTLKDIVKLSKLYEISPASIFELAMWADGKKSPKPRKEDRQAAPPGPTAEDK